MHARSDRADEPTDFLSRPLLPGLSPTPAIRAAGWADGSIGVPVVSHPRPVAYATGALVTLAVHRTLHRIDEHRSAGFSVKPRVMITGYFVVEPAVFAWTRRQP